MAATTSERDGSRPIANRFMLDQLRAQAMKTLSCLSMMIALLGLGAGTCAGASADELAKAILEKAGIHATLCELPRAGDGTLAAALVRQGVAQAHALAA